MSATTSKKSASYTLIEAKSENANSIFFTAEHKELETLHTIEIQKDEIQKYLGHCGQNWIPSNKIANIMHLDSILDICEDIVRFGGEYQILEDKKPIGYKIYNSVGGFFTVKVGESIANIIEQKGCFGFLKHEAIF